MSYKKPLKDIIAAWISGMTFPVTIYMQTTNVDGSITLSVDNIYHAQVNYPVTIGGNQYTIIAFDDTNCAMTLTVKGSAPITATAFNIYGPNFFFGTMEEITAQLTGVSDEFKCWPMIWMKEQYTEVFHNEPNPLERDSTVSLFFLIKGSHTDKRNADVYQQYLYPARRLMENFNKAINDPYSGVYTWNDNKHQESFTRLYSKQGKGTAANLFAAECIGYEVDYDLKLYRRDDDCCPVCRV